MSNSLASTGGFCVGCNEAIQHQVLSSQGYCFSASLPAPLTTAAIEALESLKAAPELVETLRRKVELFRGSLKNLKGLTISCADVSPIIHLRLSNPLASFKDEMKVLHQMVKEGMKQGILLTMPKYSVEEELFCPRPSIRVTISASQKDSDLELAAKTILGLAKTLVG